MARPARRTRGGVARTWRRRRRSMRPAVPARADSRAEVPRRGERISLVLQTARGDSLAPDELPPPQHGGQRRRDGYSERRPPSTVSGGRRRRREREQRTDHAHPHASAGVGEDPQANGGTEAQSRADDTDTRYHQQRTGKRPGRAEHFLAEQQRPTDRERAPE